MHILYVVPYAPNPIRVRPYQLIRGLLRCGHAVTVATLWSSPEERQDLAVLDAWGARVMAEPLPRWRAALNLVRALPGSRPLQAAYCWQPALARRIRQLLDAESFDVIHVEHLRGAAYGLGAQAHLADRPGSPPVVWDSVDCIAYLFEQAARHSRSIQGRLMTRLELGRTRRHEGALLQRFDRTLVTSAADQAALTALAREANPRGIIRPPAIVANGVDLAHFTPGLPDQRAPAKVVFSGKMSYHANVTAALFLVQEIMPRVWARHPHVQVQIVGAQPTAAVRALATGDPRVTVTGWVPDLRPYLQQATLAVAPVLYSAGIQNKVLEAMACATPVVTTPQAVAALQVDLAAEVAVAPDADGLAQAVVQLLEDPARRRQLGQNGRAYVERCHSWTAAVSRLEVIYQESMAQPRPISPRPEGRQFAVGAAPSRPIS